MPQISRARVAGLNPVDFGKSVEAPKALPRVTKREARKEWAAVDYGCVDWYQYHDHAKEDKIKH
jgi:hypothetical protein